MTIFILFIGLFGIFVGSFLNVLIDRLPRNENPFVGRSHCEFCRHKLSWYDLIPLISLVLLKGRCRYCKKFFGWKYPIIELTTGILFALVVIFFGNKSIINYPAYPNYLVSIFYYLFIVSCLVIIFFSDLLYGIIPDAVILPGSIISFLYLIFTSFYFLPYALFSALGAFFFFFFLFAITKGRGMGFGDVKLSFFMGIILGWPKIFLSMYLAFLTGAIVAFILVICRKKKFIGGTLPFGPFLVLGTVLSLFWGDFLIQKIISLYF